MGGRTGWVRVHQHPEHPSIAYSRGCFQCGPRAADLGASPHADAVTNLADEIHDIRDTAAAMENLDLVISADTMPAHLAGALGRPVWVLLPFMPDWRWRMEGSTTPWYPTMRLFRQRRPGDWSGAIEQVTAALQRSGTNTL